MEKWHLISLVLCTFGFFKEFRPSEPFVTEYLIDFKNFTKETIVQVAYPISTYTYFGTLPIVFLVTDFMRYKAVIIIEGLAFVGTYILLLFGNGIHSLRILEILYGIASSTEVAYYTYIYAKVDKETYKKVTSHTYTALLVGNFIAAIVSQLLVSADLMDYEQLTYLTLGSVTIALIVACFLPSVKQSVYFHRNTDNDQPLEGPPDGDEGGSKENLTLSLGQKIKRAYGYLWKDCKKAYSDAYVLKWSIWWAISSACYIQVTSYVQPLYEEIYPSTDEEIYNGGVDAVHTFLSAGLALGVGYVSLPWRKWGEPFLCLMSFIQGAALIVMSQTHEIFVAYACYIVFRTFYQVMITVASAEVAQGISQDSYGLIFGMNRFIALTIQTILTFAVADENGFSLNERDQFVVYGTYFGLLGILFAVVTLLTLCKCTRREERNA